MALWQYTLFVVPQKGFYQKNVTNVDDVEDLWENSFEKVEIFELFNKLLIKNPSWSNEIILYGKDDTNCIEVWFEEEFITFVRIRIDFRDDFNNFLKEILDFLKIYNFFLLDEELQIIDNDQSIIIRKIMNSENYKKYKVLLS